MPEKIKDIQEHFDHIVDDIDDKICEACQEVRILEQQREDTLQEFHDAMFERCYKMIKAVLNLHYPDIALKSKYEAKAKKLLAKMVGVKYSK
jgi:hypothetical protein